jgi:hypothetical protein
MRPEIPALEIRQKRPEEKGRTMYMRTLRETVTANDHVAALESEETGREFQRISAAKLSGRGPRRPEKHQPRPRPGAVPAVGTQPRKNLSGISTVAMTTCFRRHCGIGQCFSHTGISPLPFVPPIALESVRSRRER